MSSMISKTYVNEIDVSKVKSGQNVEIIVDAFPEKSYTGLVTSVANIGEQLPNADAKVFEVVIEVNESDPILRPSMTTGNKIITKTIEDVIFIPLESVQAGIDSIPFVYKKNGDKQVVVLGESNENNVVIEQGLEPGTMIYLSTPAEPEKFKLTGEDLIAVIRDREKAKKAEELRVREEAGKARNESSGRMNRGGMNITPEMMQRFQNAGGAPGGAAGPQGNITMDSAAIRRMNAMRSRQQGQQPQQQGTRRDTVARRSTTAPAAGRN
jgi:hypothetical protein